MAENIVTQNSSYLTEYVGEVKVMIQENFISRIDSIVVNDTKLLKLFQQRVQFQETIKERLEQVEQEKQHLESELTKAEQKLLTRTDQLNQSNALIEKEKTRITKAVKDRDSKRRQMETVLSALPENMKPEIIKRLSLIAKKEELASSSEIEITDSNISSIFISSETDSDDWHLFPELRDNASRKLHKNKLFPPRKSFIGADCGVHSGSENIYVQKLRSRSILDESIDVEGNSTSLRSTLPLGSLDSSNSLIFYTNIMDQLTNRQHNFLRHHSILGEKCLVCYSRIPCGKRGLKCLDCNGIVHLTCEEMVPKPCIPMKPIKSKTTSIEDHCTSFAPYVPAVVIHCVIQIEARGLQMPGLYRIPDLNKTFRHLNEELRRNRGVPNLSEVDITKIYEFLKDFLASLKPALIPANIFCDLIKKFEGFWSRDVTFDMLNDALFPLPPCNRDTLSFLVIHLQNVTKSGPCKMSARSLSKIFTPILVDNYENGFYKEERKKCGLLERFIKLPSEYWKYNIIKEL